MKFNFTPQQPVDFIRPTKPNSLRFMGRVSKTINYTEMFDLFNDNGVLSMGYIPKLQGANHFNHFHDHTTLYHVPLALNYPMRDSALNRLAEYWQSFGIYPSSSGTEANELAIKAARANWNRSRTGQFGDGNIWCFQGGFHGRTLGSLSATDTHNRDGFGPLFGDFRFFSDPDEIGRDGIPVKAIMLAPIFGYHTWYEYGIDFWKKIHTTKEKTGCMLIMDEIQCGSGRSGHGYLYSDWLEKEIEGFKVDIITLGKGVAGGMPISWTLFRTQKSIRWLKPWDHFSTFSGKLSGIYETENIFHYINDLYDSGVIDYQNQIIKKSIAAGGIKKDSITGLGTIISVSIPGKKAERFSEILLKYHICAPTFRDDAVKLSWNFNIDDEDLKQVCGYLESAAREFTCT